VYVADRCQLENGALFRGLESRVASAWTGLPDKPQETPHATLRALWFKAAGVPVSVERSADGPLPFLSPEAVQTLEDLVADRLSGTPLAYLTGRQRFMGIELLASPDALIPRQETELLAQAALEKLQDLMSERGAAIVLDICTGGGNLALALAVHGPPCSIFGSDISPEAVALARRNANLLEACDRVEFRTGDLFAPFDEERFHNSVDLIVCNPPYVSSGKIERMPREIVDFEPRLAFDGGGFGVSILFRLLADAPRFLRPSSWLYFEIGAGQGPAILRRMESSAAFAHTGAVRDRDGTVRAVFGCSPGVPGASGRLE
jgi:release factor glutamine methyltransferase